MFIVRRWKKKDNLTGLLNGWRGTECQKLRLLLFWVLFFLLNSTSWKTVSSHLVLTEWIIVWISDGHICQLLCVPQNTTVIFSLLTLDISSLKISPSHLPSSYYLLLLPSSLLPWVFLMSCPKTGASPECCGGGQRERQIGMLQRRQDVQGGLLRVGQRSWGVPEASFIALVKLFSTLQETLIPFQFY